MASKTKKKGKLLKKLKFGPDCPDWNRHVDNVRLAIKELDHEQAESIGQASFIVVTNETD